MMRTVGRTILAVVFAPPPAGAIAGLGFMASIHGSWQFPGVFVIGAAVGLALGAVVGIPLTATLGVLVHRMFVRRHWTGWWVYLLAGLLSGIPPAGLWLLVVAGSEGWTASALLPFLFSILLGSTATGGLAWLIRRPDRQQPLVPSLAETFR